MKEWNRIRDGGGTADEQTTDCLRWVLGGV